jgi:hypothetical protein
MRAAELVWGDYPEDREEAEAVLLVRMQDGFMGSVPPSDFLGEGESTLEEVGGYFSEYGEGHVEAVRSLVFALYSAAGGEEWSLVVETNEDGGTLSVSVRGVSLDVEGAWVGRPSGQTRLVSTNRDSAWSPRMLTDEEGLPLECRSPRLALLREEEHHPDAGAVGVILEPGLLSGTDQRLGLSSGHPAALPIEAFQSRLTPQDGDVGITLPDVARRRVHHPSSVTLPAKGRVGENAADAEGLVRLPRVVEGGLYDRGVADEHPLLLDDEVCRIPPPPHVTVQPVFAGEGPRPVHAQEGHNLAFDIGRDVVLAVDM